MDLSLLKARYGIGLAWTDLNLSGQPSKCCLSPFRQERNPSFSVFNGRWKDFTTGEGGDVFDFVAKKLGCDLASAIRFVEERLCITRPTWAPEAPRRIQPKLPPLHRGTDAELRQLSERRGFGIAALREAERRGFLHFCSLWGFLAWCITDSRRELHEFRRVDGEKWPAFGRLPARKCHCIGTGKAWPIGTKESEPFPRIAMTEGAPDFLAAFHFILLENKLKSVAPVGILGASNHRLAPEALVKFKDKVICLFRHNDEAGRVAVRVWARQLVDAGASRVMAFDMSGLVVGDATEGKDLADVLKINPDCFESAAGRKFQSLMP